MMFSTHWSFFPSCAMTLPGVPVQKGCHLTLSVYLNCHWLRGGVHPGEVANPSQGQVRIMCSFNVVMPEGWRSQASSIDFLQWPLHADVIRFSASFADIMYKLWIFKVLTILQHYSETAPQFLDNLQIAEPLPIFTSEWLCLSKVLFPYPIISLACCQLI